MYSLRVLSSYLCRGMTSGLILLGLMGGHSALALEGDTYISWGVDLEDSSSQIDAYVTGNARERLAMINERAAGAEIPPRINSKIVRTSYTRPEDYDCTTAAYYIMASFRRPIVQLMESWIVGNPEIDVHPDPKDMFVWTFWRNSVYNLSVAPVFLFMSRNVNYNGIYFSTDKFGHFVSFGTKYYERYVKLINAGLTEEEAEKELLDWGIFTENVLVGKMWTGIFSHGDLEANYQGFRLIKNLCDSGSEPYIHQQGSGEWELVGDITLKPYITPDFDEAYNPSVFSDLMWSRVSKNIRENGYCEQWPTEAVQQRYAYYDSFKKSRAHQYYRDLMGRGELEDNQSFHVTSACQGAVNRVVEN
jgi:hypothetical protein